jgi:hypothetical protein
MFCGVFQLFREFHNLLLSPALIDTPPRHQDIKGNREEFDQQNFHAVLGAFASWWQKN